MPETRLEEVVEERSFALDLQDQAALFFRLANTLLEYSPEDRLWNKRHYYQFINEADSLESFLDDFGARYNQTFSGFTELVASLRWFAYSGFSIAHLLSRFRSYGDSLWEDEGTQEAARAEIREGLVYIQRTAHSLIQELFAEAESLGLELPSEAFSEKSLLPVAAQKKLPRTVGQERLIQEDQKIAEVASQYLQAASMLNELGVRKMTDAAERHRFVESKCTEASARVYQATVHNLQSTYDTHLQNTVLEHADERLPLLRGHASMALHLLQAVTYLAHFIERHESEVHAQAAKLRISALVQRDDVEHFTVNVFLFWAERLMHAGVHLAEDLLPVYSNLQELRVQLGPNVRLHARPAALIVNIVHHWGTPVEMELAGHRCNAGSILELLVMVGSNPDHSDFLFRGDERPLRDIDLLFIHGLGEDGISALPVELAYLKDFS